MALGAFDSMLLSNRCKDRKPKVRWRALKSPLSKMWRVWISIAWLVRMHASISHNYRLDTSSLLGIHSPQYHLDTPLIKRQDNAGVFMNATSASFIIYLTCTNTSIADCQTALNHLVRAARRIENVIYFSQPTRLNATFGPFCRESSQCDSGSVLGQAAPSSWFAWSMNDTIPTGIDRSYAYPSSLVRQWVPNDAIFRNSLPDIDASFNSEINWWFSSRGADSVGMMQNGDFGPSSKNPQSPLKSFDFEQVATHELLHGLGFVSGWFPWFGDDFYFPSFPTYDSSGMVTGIGHPFIFDKWISDAVNGFWMRDYASIIQRDLQKVLNDSYSTWRTSFAQTEGGKIAKALGEKGGPLVTPRGLWSWYPVIEDERVLHRYVILYTPSLFDHGSSCSHMDDQFYAGTTQYLMKPYAARDVGLDGYSPYDPLGPINESILGILRSVGYATIL